VENGYGETFRLKITSRLLEQILNIPEKVKNYFLFNMKKVCKVIVDFAITFNFLSGFTKQRNTEVASKTSSKVIPRLHFS